MITKARINLTIDKVVLSESRIVLRELGISFSKFMEIVLCALVDSKTKPLSEVYEPLIKEFHKAIKKRE